jgi:hypothetical protein
MARAAQYEKWKKAISVRLDKETVKFLSRRADREKTTLSALIRRIVESHAKT